VDESGTVSESHKAPTPAHNLGDLISELVGLITTLQKQAKVVAVGIGIPGLRSVRTREIQTSPHIPCLQNVNLEAPLRERIGLPVVTENDANAGAYGEWASGAAKGLQHVVYITLGTGLGCGLVLSGTLFRGASGYAGEFGHTTVEPFGRRCACGAIGCLETRVSATGIVRTAREHLEKNPQSVLQTYQGDQLTAHRIYDAAIQGDKVAVAVFEETSRFLGLACANVMNLLNPEMIVIGGGVMASGEILLNGARKEAQLRAFRPSFLDCPIVQSKLWPDSGIIGAAMLARDAA
jgi:glucokinase